MAQDAFDSALDLFMQQFPSCIDQMNTAGAQTDANRAAAEAAAVTATAQANAAVAAAGAIAWVSGTTYAIGVRRYSLADLRTYQRLTNGAGTTDPASDPTNWRIVPPGAYPYMKVSDRKTSGTAGGASVANDNTQRRTLNTSEVNTIPGASLSGDQITLPAGTYRLRARAPANNLGLHKLFFYNVTDSSYQLIGSSASAPASSNAVSDGVISGQFTISDAKTFELRHRTESAVAINGLGRSVGSGQVEIYAEVEIEMVA
jgi:hypothetical protein